MATVNRVEAESTTFGALAVGSYFERPDASLWLKLDSVNGYSFSTGIIEAIDGAEVEYQIAQNTVTVTYPAPAR